MNKGPLLLVDDDRDFCEVLTRALTRRGFEVYGALDLEAAMSLAERYSPHFAVIDLCLGLGSSGLVMLERLMLLDPGIRAVVLTGYGSIATAVEAIKLGAVHYLTKPTNADEIVAALHRNAANPDLAIERRPLSVRRLEWEHLQKVLVDCNGNISAAARRLRMHRRTLQRKLQKRPVRE